MLFVKRRNCRVQLRNWASTQRKLARVIVQITSLYGQTDGRTDVQMTANKVRIK